MKNRLKLIWAKFQSMTLEEFVTKSFNKFSLFLKLKIKSQIDYKTNTRSDCPVNLSFGVIDISSIDRSQLNSEPLQLFANRVFAHEFNLLGSGWVNVAYGNTYNGLKDTAYPPEKHSLDVNQFPIENLKPAHRPSAHQILDKISGEYVPIDWQVDFKSGFRWSEAISSSNQNYGFDLGADIKVPWEIARFQHLPNLAIFAIANPESRLSICKEIKNEILDFIAMNPPRMGVNWVCSMDVGIRAVNLLIAVDIAKQVCDDVFEPDFLKIFSNSIYEHGLHIVNHLEYSKELTSNHYLANISGLLFVSAYLEANEELNQWLAFSIQELISEVDRQFYHDGCNFEGSSSYHRLSTEMLIYSVATICGLTPDRLASLKQYSSTFWRRTPNLNALKHQKFIIGSDAIDLPDEFLTIIYKATQFTADITNVNGNIWQFGDNDSGRFITFLPNLLKCNKSDSSKLFDLELSNLNHISLNSAANGLFANRLESSQQIDSIEEYFVRLMSGGSKQKLDIDQNIDRINLVKLCDESHFKFSKTIIVDVSAAAEKGSLLNGLNSSVYPIGGVVIYKSDRLFLGLNCIPNGSKGSGGHSHNDQLSIELFIDGKSISRDPGSYLYTPAPYERNRFRSVHAHNTLRTELEPNGFFGQANSLFVKNNSTTCGFSHIDENSAVMELVFDHVQQRRTVQVCENQLIIKDESNIDFDNTLNKFKEFSPGYGSIETGCEIPDEFVVRYV